MPISMTRAEYEAKYGQPPSLPDAQTQPQPTPQATPQTPKVNTGGPIRMTHAEYMAKYGSSPSGPKDQGILQKVAGAFEPGGIVQKAGKAIEDATGISKAGEMAQKGTPLQAAGAFGESALNIGALALGPEGVLANAGLGAATGVARGLAEKKSIGDTVKGAAGDAAVYGSIPFASALIERGAQEVLPKVSQWLEKVNLRLTPSQKQKLGTTLNDVTKFMSEKGIVGTPEGRYAKATSMYEDTEKKLQSFLTTEAKNGVAVSKTSVVSDLQRLKTSLMKDSSDASIIDKQINSAIENIKAQYKGSKIPIDRLNNLKRSTYQNAYNQAGDKVLNDVEHDIGDTMRKSIEGATKGKTIDGKSVSEFNKDYGKLIQGRKLLRIAQGKNQLGLFGRGLATFLGAGAVHSLGLGGIDLGVGAYAAEEGANKLATPVRSLIGAGSTKAASAAPAVVKGARRIAPTLISGMRDKPSNN